MKTPIQSCSYDSPDKPYAPDWKVVAACPGNIRGYVFARVLMRSGEFCHWQVKAGFNDWRYDLTGAVWCDSIQNMPFEDSPTR
jgi:hypothetical protein